LQQRDGLELPGFDGHVLAAHRLSANIAMAIHPALPAKAIAQHARRRN
jgi:hypothetical protein